MLLVNFLGGGRVDWAALSTALKFHKPKAVLVQRSCGYSFRPTLSIRDIGKKFFKSGDQISFD